MDSLLQRQLRRAGLSADRPPAEPDRWASLLDHVGRAYAEHRQERYLLERSLEVSSREMQQLYEELRLASASEVAGERDKLQAIIDGFSDGFCTLDTEGRPLTINPAGRALLGLAPGESDPGLLARFACRRTRESPQGIPAAELIARVRAGHTVRDERAELARRDGTSVPVSVLLYPIVQGLRITGCALTFRDTSTLHRTEGSRRRLAMAVEASADAIYITDPKGTIEYVNPAFVAVTGWEMAEAVGRTPSILKCGRTPPELYRTLWETILAGQVWRGRLRNRRRNGEGAREYWAQTTVAPIKDSEERLVGFVAVQRDVTAEVEQEERRQRETRAAEVRARVAQVLLGEESLSVRLGAAVQALGGLPGLTLLGPALVAVANPEGCLDIPLRLGAVPEGLPKALCAAPPLDLAPVYRPELGGLLVPIPHAGGILGALWIATSAPPELAAAEDDLLRLLAGMAGIAVVDDRARREAERARQAALDAVQAKARFLANMSHEIRTPMNGVLGMLEMLSQTAMSPQQRDYVDTAHGSADSLLTIINDILDYSKIEAGKLDLEHIPFDVRPVVEEIATLFNARAQSQGLELACFVPVRAATRVVGDPTRLRQVLGNILGNAVKFTRQGEVVLTVKELESADGRRRLRFEVEDTGIGMTPEQRERLFQPFVQADGSTTRRFGGTGLGLAICKQLVELMGGQIGVESDPGAGSRFWFAIPFESQPEDSGALDGSSLGGARVLAVDDNATNLAILSHYLESWGLEHASAGDGFEALARLREAARQGQPFEIALVDMQMPRLDGLALGQLIKEDPEIAATRLLMLSSIGQTEGQLKEAGFLYALSKPIRQSALHDTLIRMRHPGAAEGGEPGRAVRVAPRVAPAPQAPLGRLKGRVLLAEDNPINQRVAVGMLTRLGLEVELAAQGALALARVAAEPFDLLLMDCEMPVMDGFQATRALRALETEQARNRLPVIALTANAMTGDRERCIAAGMDDYISKPIKLGQLQQTLARWLPGADGGEQGELGSAGGPGSGEEPPIEPGNLKVLGELMGDGFLRFLDRFEDRSSELVESIAECIARDAPEELRRAAYHLKVSAGHLGAGRIYALAQRLESLAQEGRLAEAEASLGTLRLEHVRALAAIADLRAPLLAQGEG